MKVVVDVEANGLENPTKIWVIVCKDIDTGQIHVFRDLADEKVKATFLAFCESVSLWIGHNWLGYDYPVINRLLGYTCPSLVHSSIDTLVVSKLLDYSREGGHSVEEYGLEFGQSKIKFTDFSKYSKEMEDYCIRDVEITHKIYLKYKRYIHEESWQPALHMEQEFQLLVNELHDNGFYFNSDKAEKLLSKILEELDELDRDIKAIPPRVVPGREVNPRLTKFGTLNKADFRFVRDNDLSDYHGGPFCRFEYREFNPSSHKQLIDVLHEAGWSPIDKTKTHVQTERELSRLKYQNNKSKELDLRVESLYTSLNKLGKYGWKINENNLATLPKSAPSSARLLAKRILLEARRRTLVEWLSLVRPDTGRIHGKFYGIGAWTHRMAHQNPNTANIPTEAKLFGKEMRSLWCVPKNRLLLGVDAEGIQLRIFAHYINDPEFTDSLVKGRKDDKTDPHSLNQRILGRVCGSRQTAKRFVYALLLGAGLGKLTEILDCTKPETEEALGRLLQRYTGFAYLRESVIPLDAKRGWFLGLDGRKVRIPGETPGQRKHLCMSGYLQNGEAVVMKLAAIRWWHWLKKEKLLAFIVNFVHDEWQTEGPNDVDLLLRIAKYQADSLRIVGEELGLKCPLAGSYWNEDHKDYTIGTNWYQTH